jgi:hypothetical protein
VFNPQNQIKKQIKKNIHYDQVNFTPEFRVGSAYANQQTYKIVKK